MIVVIEVNGPFQSKPGKFKSRTMTRYWWGWFAIGFIHFDSFKAFCDDYKKSGEWRL